MTRISTFRSLRSNDRSRHLTRELDHAQRSVLSVATTTAPRSTSMLSQISER